MKVKLSRRGTGGLTMSCSCKHNKEEIDNGLAGFGECEEMSDEIKNIIKRGVALYRAADRGQRKEAKKDDRKHR